MTSSRTLLALLVVLIALPALAFERQDVTFKVFQFPASMAPRIDGNTDDWKIVPDDYAIPMEQFLDTEHPDKAVDKKNLDVKVKVGWVKGQNRLYFLYEAFDNYWDFSLPGLHNDIFEVVVDGDASGGALVDQVHKDIWDPAVVGVRAAIPDPRLDRDAAARLHGVQAQNYHIFTPPGPNKNWAMEWGCPQYGIDLPYSEHAYKYSFKPGESGNLVLEFYITPFDYAGCEGPWRAVESLLTENKLIGLGLGVIDFDNVDARQRDAFWNLSHQQLWYGDASLLPAFKLMPLEPQFQDTVEKKFPTTGEGFPGGPGGPGGAKPAKPAAAPAK